MAEPANEMAAGAGGCGHLRASHAEREQAIGLLKAAFVQGRLAKDEFDLRVGQALTSRTRGELACLTADIPAGLTAAQPARPAGESGGAKVALAVTAVFAAWWGIVVAASFWMSENGSAQRSPGVLIGILVLYASIVWVWLIAAWLGRRARRRSAQGRSPGRGGQASERPVSADPAGQPGPGLRSAYRGPSYLSRYAIGYYGQDRVSWHDSGPR
jgi:hypothetical protein